MKNLSQQELDFILMELKALKDQLGVDLQKHQYYPSRAHIIRIETVLLDED